MADDDKKDAPAPADAPKQDAPKEDAAPKQEAPKQEAPKAEAPKTTQSSGRGVGLHNR